MEAEKPPMEVAKMEAEGDKSRETTNRRGRDGSERSFRREKGEAK